MDFEEMLGIKRKVMSVGNRVGEAALPFSLWDHDGRECRLDDFKESWLLMVFHRHQA